MMMGPCIKGVSSTGMRTVSKRYIFTRPAHFIEAKSRLIRLTVRDNCRLISFITKANGSMTCHMEKAGRYTEPTHTLRASSSTAKSKASVCTTGTPKNTTQAISQTT